jgi:hypothetical protein
MTYLCRSFIVSFHDTRLVKLLSDYPIVLDYAVNEIKDLQNEEINADCS